MARAPMQKTHTSSGCAPECSALRLLLTPCPRSRLGYAGLFVSARAQVHAVIARAGFKGLKAVGVRDGWLASVGRLPARDVQGAPEH